MKIEYVVTEKEVAKAFFERATIVAIAWFGVALITTVLVFSHRPKNQKIILRK